MAIALALFSSLLISGTTIIMKKGIERSNPTSAMLVVTLVGTLILLAISLPQIQLEHLKSKAFLLFVLAGILSPAIVRWLYFISLDRIGPSMSSSAHGPYVTGSVEIEPRTPSGRRTASMLPRRLVYSTLSVEAQSGW